MSRPGDDLGGSPGRPASRGNSQGHCGLRLEPSIVVLILACIMGRSVRTSVPAHRDRFTRLSRWGLPVKSRFSRCSSQRGPARA